MAKNSTLVVKGEIVRYYDGGRYHRIRSFRSALEASDIRTTQIVLKAPDDDETTLQDKIDAGSALVIIPPGYDLDGERHLIIVGDAESIDFFTTTSGTANPAETLPFNGVLLMRLPDDYRRVIITGNGNLVDIITAFVE